MTEEEWLSSQVGSELLEFLAEDLPQSDRKMRLAACACCRRVERFVASFDFRELLRHTEASADDPLREQVRVLLFDRLNRAWQERVARRPFYDATPRGCRLATQVADNGRFIRQPLVGKTFRSSAIGAARRVRRRETLPRVQPCRPRHSAK